MVSLTLLSLFPANYSFDYNSCVSKVAGSSTLNRGLEAEGGLRGGGGGGGGEEQKWKASQHCGCSLLHTCVTICMYCRPMLLTNY